MELEAALPATPGCQEGLDGTLERVYLHQILPDSQQVLGYPESDYARRFGIEINPAVHSVTARVLPPPTLKYASAFNPREESFAVRSILHMSSLTAL